jgi:hypothetical protein
LGLPELTRRPSRDLSHPAKKAALPAWSPTAVLGAKGFSGSPWSSLRSRTAPGRILRMRGPHVQVATVLSNGPPPLLADITCSKAGVCRARQPRVLRQVFPQTADAHKHFPEKKAKIASLTKWRGRVRPPVPTRLSFGVPLIK